MILQTTTLFFSRDELKVNVMYLPDFLSVFLCLCTVIHYVK